MVYQQSNVEVSNREIPRESNLSPTAQLVHRVMGEIVMPELAAQNLIVEANEIIVQKITPDSSEAIDFTLKCREAEMACRQRNTENDPKVDAVISNYFSKLLKSVQPAV